MSDKKSAPRLDILPAPQRALWAELTQVPRQFVLYGGTAIALRLGHRESADFDFFGNDDFDPDLLAASVPFMSGAQIVQKAANTLTGIVDRNGPVQVSFFGVPHLLRLSEPDVAPDNGVQIASLIDLAAMKTSVVQKRAEAKDYLDIEAMLSSRSIDLPTALSAGVAVYGQTFNPQITLKALSYFGDGNLVDLPERVKRNLVDAVRAVDLDNLPEIRKSEGTNDHSHPAQP